MDISRLKARYSRAREEFLQAEKDYIRALESAHTMAQNHRDNSSQDSLQKTESMVFDELTNMTESADKTRIFRDSSMDKEYPITGRRTVLGDITNTPTAVNRAAVFRDKPMPSSTENRNSSESLENVETPENGSIGHRNTNGSKILSLMESSRSQKPHNDLPLDPNDDIVLSQDSVVTVEVMSSSPMSLKPVDCADASDRDSYCGTDGSSEQTEHSIMPSKTAGQSKLAAKITSTTPTPNKRRFSAFQDEIDEDLLSGNRRTTFSRPASNSQLITPKSISANTTIKKPARSLLDSFLKPSPKEASTPTPKFSGKLSTLSDGVLKSKPRSTEAPPASAPAPAPTASDMKFENYEVFYNHVMDKKWRKTDFVVNPESNDNLSHAFQSSLRGKERMCAHGRACTQCTKFYELAGDFSSVGSRAINQSSRHRSKWAPEDSPPGFWRTDFPNTQEAEKDAAEREEQLQQQTHERLLEALTPHGRFMFRDLEYRKELKRLVASRAAQRGDKSRVKIRSAQIRCSKR